MQLIAPAHGRICSLAEHPDAIIRQGLMGSGLMLRLHGHELVAPVDGELEMVSASGNYWRFLLANQQRLILQLGTPTEQTFLTGIKRMVNQGPIKQGRQLLKLQLPDLKRALGHTDLAVLFPEQTADSLAWSPGSVRQGDTPFIQLL